MEQLLEQIKNVNDTANGFIWGTFGIVFLLGTGIVCTIVTKCPQITRFGHIVKNTFGQLFKKDIHKKMDNDPGTLSQFQAVCIVHGFAHWMGGFVKIKSEKGEGTKPRMRRKRSTG
ncbi:MAG: hypothetical protein ILP08_00180 [Lachnospiraceae bacterium]|nr:hypothetical protein [Lachnospiraceae bacterium]